MFVTGERPDLRFYIAAALACAGVFLQNAFAREPRAAPAAPGA
jgi:hypothetical protein